MQDAYAILVGLIGLLLPGFGADEGPRYTGYIEADYLYVASESAGRIATIAVAEGETVAAGAALFTLDDDQQRAQLHAAEARVAAAEAGLADLGTGSRSDEIDVIRASLDRARSELQLARESAARSEQLFAEGIVPQSRLDQDRTGLRGAEAALAQLEAQLKVAELPARDARLAQAEADLAAARAGADSARLQLDDRAVAAPVAGRVERLYFSPGEIVAAATPVLALLPDNALEVRFYLPEPDREALHLGDRLAIGCDGCGHTLVATISHFAAEPQFTPPVIYSREERHRLTFLVRATLSGGTLHPGQPVTLAPLP